MNPIQVVLIALVLLAVFFYLSRLRSQLADRLLVMLIAVGALVLVIAPNLSNRVAFWFGVGRGADFVFYLTHAGMIIIVIMLYSKLRQQSEQITKLTRELAIQKAMITQHSEKEKINLPIS